MLVQDQPITKKMKRRVLASTRYESLPKIGQTSPQMPRQEQSESSLLMMQLTQKQNFKVTVTNIQKSMANMKPLKRKRNLEDSQYSQANLNATEPNILIKIAGSILNTDSDWILSSLLRHVPLTSCLLFLLSRFLNCLRIFNLYHFLLFSLFLYVSIL